APLGDASDNAPLVIEAAPTEDLATAIQRIRAADERMAASASREEALSKISSIVEGRKSGTPSNVVGSVPGRGVVPANLGDDGKIYVGKPGGVHFEIDRPEGVEWKDTGFINPEGKYLDRKAALKWVDENEKAIKPSENMEGQLDALDYREQVPASMQKGGTG